VTTSQVERARGRPLDADRTPAIEAAALELLRSVGYDRLRMQDVAKRAGVGLATIYRRWATKQELMSDALRAQTAQLLPERTGDARADLTALLRALATHLSGDAGELIPGFLTAMRSEPELAATFHELVAEHVRELTRALVADVVGRDDPTLDLRADIGPSLLLFRSMFLGEPVDPDDVERIIDVVVGPR
jgi:AcrR family transcriptional regulator